MKKIVHDNVILEHAKGCTQTTQRIRGQEIEKNRNSKTRKFQSRQIIREEDRQLPQREWTKSVQEGKHVVDKVEFHIPKNRGNIHHSRKPQRKEKGRVGKREGNF